MSRRVLIAGNWKLNKTVGEALELVKDLKRLTANVRDCDIAVAPVYTALWAVGEQLKDSNIALASQEHYFEDGGAFTGTVSAPMCRDVGCTYAIVGHSERRQLFGETLESSRKRLDAALRAGLRPILCVGETLEEREAGKTNDVVGAQFEGALEGFSVDLLKDLVVAYEPVWAIGTGKVATTAQAQDVHAVIRERLHARDSMLAESTRILYGGSVKPDNAAELLACTDIDGALVGGASLKADSFSGIIKAR